MESFSKPSISNLQRVYSVFFPLRTEYYFIINMINVRNLCLILCSCESCNRENHPKLWPQGEIVEDKICD